MSKRNPPKPLPVDGLTGEPLTPMEIKKEDAVEESLSTIFRDEHGEMPDLTKLDHRRRSPLLMASIGIAAFITILIAVAWAGFILFKPFRGFEGEGLQIDIDGPRRVVLGEETTYFINWRNAASEPLAAADIRVNFPVDFSVTRVEPAPTGDGFAWRLGSVPYGGRGTVTVHGVFSGALGTKTAVQAVGSYRPASFNSDFEALATRELEYADTVLSGTMVVPQKAIPGDTIRLTYMIQNLGLTPMKHLEARITLPPGFVRAASSTSEGGLDERTVRLPVGDLAGGASATVAVIGAFASGHAGEASIHAETGRIGGDGSFQAAQKTDATFIVLSGDLTLKLVVNGGDTDQTIGYGDILRVAIGYENAADEAIKDVTIRFRVQPFASSGTAPTAGTKTIVEPAYIDWEHVEDVASGTISGNSIIWSRSKMSDLDRLAPRQDGSVEFALPTLLSATGSPSVFQIVAEATMQSVGDTVVNRTVTTAPIALRFRTDADLAVEARYFSEEGAPLGSGPLPPVAGQTTRYRIFWDLTKTVHEVRNIRVSATLPKRVAWPNKTTISAGEIRYDEASRIVSWTLNRMPKDVDEAHVTFDVDLTPSDFDIGRFADLLGDTRFETLDADINEQVTRSKPALSTDLQNDEGARSKGVVRKP
jgi:hypothetical protein